MSSYFPMTGFRATVCALTVDNRYDCVPTIWGVLFLESFCLASMFASAKHNYSYQFVSVEQFNITTFENKM